METMKNSDLIAYLKPIASRFSQGDTLELRDATGRVTDIHADKQRLTLRFILPAGLYRGRLETLPGSFDMSTAMIDMVRVPDGKRVPVGPWDLDHIHNVMAMPMICTYVNGSLKGGLWFSMPGPTEIKEGRLTAEFGFEAQEGENELILELIERDLQRIDWGRLAYLELREDDRLPVSLKPASPSHPRIFLHAHETEQVRERWRETPTLKHLRQQLSTEELVFLTDNSQGTLELACLVYALTGDPEVGARARQRIVELARAPTWSGRPDPLLMGGDNDRGISLRLYLTALGWAYLQPLLNDSDRQAMLAKAEEYIGKMYDFTLLQRGYMGCPAIDPHALGAWNGTAIACMAFFDDLAIARRALPFFHGLFCTSLKLFPDSGKAAWATYFPFHLVLYLAAAHTFGGHRPELDSSAFLDNLGEALLASFDVPNSQELQRGMRTREHRFLTSFLCRFHPTPGIESIYRAFIQREISAAGNVVYGIFDLLYAPQPSGPIASFPDRPLLAHDVGDLIATVHGEHTLAVSLSGGPKAGRKAVFHLMPQNREFPPSMGALEVAVNGTPVLCNINMSTYGLNSALTNTMCFEEGGMITNGQYLNGAVSPDRCGSLRRCLIDDRYLYAHIVITYALHPEMCVRHADRVFILDRTTGVMLLSDQFQGDRAIQFATHLHCSGSVTELAKDHYRLTGGQANLIAGIKGGGKGLDDAERGEIFVQVLNSRSPTRVVVEEPTWVPGYIYGLNNTGQETLSDGRFPRYRRWRLEAQEPVTQGAFLLALGAQPGQATFVDGTILLPDGGRVQFGPGPLTAIGVDCVCECLLWDEATHRIMAMGLSSLKHHSRKLTFSVPVDMTYNPDDAAGTLYAEGAVKPSTQSGFRLDLWEPIGDERWKTLNIKRAGFIQATTNKPSKEVGA
jgi:hypothetical protein